MAYVRCPNCGEIVENLAGECPKCGYSFEEEVEIEKWALDIKNKDSLKKLFSILGSIIFLGLSIAFIALYALNMDNEGIAKIIYMIIGIISISATIVSLLFISKAFSRVVLIAVFDKTTVLVDKRFTYYKLYINNEVVDTKVRLVESENYLYGTLKDNKRIEVCDIKGLCTFKMLEDSNEDK